MELRSRSRSKTPFLQQKSDDSDRSSSSMITRSRKSTNITASEHYITSSTTTIKKARKLQKTSDYSSEEGESDFKHITENQRNQIIEDAKAAANGTTRISALDLYRKAGRYWDKYPKTDWTYSPHSKDRIEIAPGVVQMPNMSRPTIHSFDTSTNTDLTFRQHYSKSQIEHHNEENWLIRCINYIKSLFISSNDVTSSTKASATSTTTTLEESDFIIRKSTKNKSFINYFTSIFLSIFSLIYLIYYLQNSLIVWFGKKIHHFTSRLMLIDTWLLMRRRRNGNKINRLLLLCLLPLIIFTGWWLVSAIGNTISTYLTTGNATLPPFLTTTETTARIPTTFVKVDDDEDRVKRSPSQFNTIPPNTDEIVDRIVKNPEISRILNQQQSIVDDNYQRLLLIIDELKREVDRVNQKLLVVERLHSNDLKRISIKYQTDLKRCCSDFINLENYIRKILTDLLNNPEFLANNDALNHYLHNLFITKQQLELKLSNLTQNLPNDYHETIEQTAIKVMDRIVAKIDTNQLTDKRIEELIRKSLMVYDADKTGLVDYAMETMGGEIVTTRCTEAYLGGPSVSSIFNIPFWYHTKTPRVVITPSINPGDCWAFQNFPGFLVIKLSNRIRIDAFTMEHVSRLLVPNGRIDSAPKEFEVYGLNDENDPDPILLGDYFYDYDGDSMQYFTVQQSEAVFDMIELRIKSNHGNPNYTCLYRFRVHGSTV